MRDTPHARELATASVISGDSESRIERLFVKHLGQNEIRFSWWKNDQMMMRPLDLPESELLELFDLAIQNRVFSQEFLFELGRLLSGRTMPGQRQEEIALRFSDQSTGVAVRTGNNAAWLCRCGREQPLVGYSDAADSPSVASTVQCPRCGRTYRVVAESLKKVPTHVAEMAESGT